MAACGASGTPTRTPQTPRAPLRAPTPKLEEDLPPLATPAARTSTLAVTFRLPLSAVAQAIDAAIPKAEERDWTRLTERGASPEVEARYRVEREAPEVDFRGGTLRVSIPLRFWADVRGRVRSPLPWQKNRWFSLDGTESWGTPRAPQRARAEIESEIAVDERWQLRVKSGLRALEFGAPPEGSFCVKLGIRLCVEKASFAPQVHRELRSVLGKALERALGEVEARIQAHAKLPTRARQLWRRLHCRVALHRGAEVTCEPVAGDAGSWLVFAPERLALSALSPRDRALELTAAARGELSLATAAPPTAPAPPLPAPGALERGQALVLRAPLRLPLGELDAWVRGGLPPPATTRDRVEVVAIHFLGGGVRAGRRALWLEARLAGATEAVLYASAIPTASGERLAFEALELTPASIETLRRGAPKTDSATVERALVRALTVDLTKTVAALERTATLFLRQSPLGEGAKARLSKLDVERLDVERDAVVAWLRIRAEVSVDLGAVQGVSERRDHGGSGSSRRVLGSAFTSTAAGRTSAASRFAKRLDHAQKPSSLELPLP